MADKRLDKSVFCPLHPYIVNADHFCILPCGGGMDAIPRPHWHLHCPVCRRTWLVLQGGYFYVMAYCRVQGDGSGNG